MTQKKNRKYFESKINNLEHKMSDAEGELLGIGQEILSISHYDNNYIASIATDNDGLIFLKKEDCDDPFVADEISVRDVLKNLNI